MSYMIKFLGNRGKDKFFHETINMELNESNYICNYSAKKVKRSKKRLDRVFWGKAKLHLCPSVLSILA